MTVRTYGLTHVALAVRNPRRSLEFYRAILGVVPIYEDANVIQAQTPDARDVLVFQRQPARAGRSAGGSEAAQGYSNRSASIGSRPDAFRAG